MKFLRIATVVALMAATMAAHADYFGAPSGRSANPANNPKLSVEGSVSDGSGYRNIGARVSFGVNDKITIYGDFGISDVGVYDGNSFGGGIFFYLPIINGFDSAIQGSFHTAALDFFSSELDVTALGATFLISPQTPIASNGLTWYANAGVNVINRDFSRRFFRGSSDNSVEPQIGGGIYLPLGPGTFYAGGDIIDGLIVGAGYRFGF